MNVPLDQRQLNNIEAVHRGFLYQHLYVVACLLLAKGNDIISVIVEFDEDIEIEFANGDHLYIQIKTRSTALSYNDIKTTLKRFSELRELHVNNERSGKPAFVVVANTEPNSNLKRKFENRIISTDIKLLSPKNNRALLEYLPPSWSTLDDSINWCINQAKALPMLLIDPETLVWKLAGLVSLAATGASNHRFDIHNLSRLFEQLIVQLHKFPSPPIKYRPQEGEPSLISDNRIRIISGFSGAGKTSWASHAAMYLGNKCAYYDVGDTPTTAVTSSLVRELAAQWAVSVEGGIRSVLLPGVTGREALCALDNLLECNNIPALVILDNAHKINVDDLLFLIKSTNHLKFILIMQPSKIVNELEGYLGVSSEILKGWGIDQCAAEVRELGVNASITDLVKLQNLTGGLPLFVQSAVQLSIREYDGDISRMCIDIESNVHLSITSQEIILNRTFDSLSEVTRNFISILSLSDVPLTKGEASNLVNHLFCLDSNLFFKKIRELNSMGVIRLYNGNKIKIHDAFRLIGLQQYSEFSVERAKLGREILRDIIKESLLKVKDNNRLSFFTKILVELGELKTLIELASEELFHELGISNGIWEMLDIASLDENINPEQRFYALDGLIFSEIKAGKNIKLEERLKRMENLVYEFKLGSHEEMLFLLKKMMFESQNGNICETKDIIKKLKKQIPDDPEFHRILNYSIARSLFLLKEYSHLEVMLEELIEEYYKVLNLSQKDVIRKNPNEIYKKLDSTPDNWKHLGDVFDLLARTLECLGKNPLNERIQAGKFYELANALDSLVSVQQDIVDDLLSLNKCHEAREFMEEQLLPMVKANNMVARIIPTRSQYAVVLAYCGEFAFAYSELDQIKHYQSGLNSSQISEIENQRQLIDKILAQSLTLARLLESASL